MALVRNIGAGAQVRQIQTVTVANTWATGDTGTLTINNKPLTLTAGALVATTDIAAAISRMVNAARYDEQLIGDESRNFGGQEIPEFREIEATVSGSVVTLRAKLPGVPFTLTVSENTAGSGTLATSVTTSAAGPSYLSTAANYSGGAVPSDNDTLILDTGEFDILDALTAFRSGSLDLNMIVSNDWRGQLGRPPLHPGGYPEYRERWFQFRGGSKFLEFVRGTKGYSDSRPCWIDLQDQAGVIIRCFAARGNVSATPTIYLCGADASTLTNVLSIEEGAVSIEPDDAPTNASKYFAVNEMNVGKKGGTPTSPLVWIGRNARIYKTSSGLAQYSGTVWCDAILKNSDQCDVRIYGGTFYAQSKGDSLDTGDFTVYDGGTLHLGGGIATVGTVTVFRGGTVDMSTGAKPVIQDKLILYPGATLIDRAGRFTPDFHIPGGALSDINFQGPLNREWNGANVAAP